GVAALLLTGRRLRGAAWLRPPGAAWPYLLGHLAAALAFAGGAAPLLSVLGEVADGYGNVGQAVGSVWARHPGACLAVWLALGLAAPALWAAALWTPARPWLVDLVAALPAGLPAWFIFRG